MLTYFDKDLEKHSPDEPRVPRPEIEPGRQPSEINPTPSPDATPPQPPPEMPPVYAAA